ncbi:MAG: HD-GYP domain-containing protein [Fibrobacteres bacterium]|nr:HD-GYP domain-containing protein [Fibrobacterota bacterium]
MEPYQQQISILEGAPGMFVDALVTDKGFVRLSQPLVIETKEQLNGFVSKGVTGLIINKNKGVSPETIAQNAATDQAARESAYYKELEQAKEIHIEAVSLATRTLKSVRNGGDFQYRAIRDLCEKLSGSILRNADAMVSLTQIKGDGDYHPNHSVNVAVLMSSMASDMGYKGENLIEVALGGYLHDLGMMRIPEAIINKPGKLTDGEYATIKRHPEFSLEMLNAKSGVSDLTKKIAIQHHERFNGKGYPLGHPGSRLHEMAYVAAVADTFDAMTTDRAYKEAWTPQKALATIFQGCDAEFSRKTVELFTRHLGIFPVGSFVRLVNGEMGIVIRVGKGRLLTPKLLLLFNRQGERMAVPKEVDLYEKQNSPEKDSYKIEVSLSPKVYNVNIAEYVGNKAL